VSRASAEKPIGPVSAQAVRLSRALAEVVDAHDPTFADLAQAVGLLLCRLALSLAEQRGPLFTGEAMNEQARRALAAYEHLYHVGQPEVPAFVLRLADLLLATAAGPEAVRDWFDFPVGEEQE